VTAHSLGTGGINITLDDLEYPTDILPQYSTFNVTVNYDPDFLSLVASEKLMYSVTWIFKVV
jgi:hypothetical protein